MGPMDTPEGDHGSAAEVPPRRIEISLTQLIAGSAAAVCGAWLASRVGVAGTVIGAGLVSALVTVLSAVYAHGARQARERLHERLEAIRTRGPLPASYAADSPGTALASPGAAGATGVSGPAGPAGVAGVAGLGERPAPAKALLLPPFDLEDSRGYRWGRIALAALAVFILGMGAVTVVELVAGHSLACTAAGIGCAGTTTLPIPGRPASTPAPTKAPSATPTATLTSTPTPSASSTPTPTGSTSTSGSPTGSPTSTPSTSPSASTSPSPSSSLTG